MSPPVPPVAFAELAGDAEAAPVWSIFRARRVLDACTLTLDFESLRRPIKSAVESTKEMKKMRHKNNKKDHSLGISFECLFVDIKEA